MTDLRLVTPDPHRPWLHFPQCGATNYGAKQLRDWMLEAEQGSIEQRILGALAVAAAWDGQTEPTALVVIQAWAALRAQLDPALHLRSTDVALRLPFPLSQALTSFSWTAVMAEHSGILEQAAAMAGEMLAAFPDEDPRVALRIASDRAAMLVNAGRDAGHVEAKRLIAAHPESAVPVAAYVGALKWRSFRVGPTEKCALLRQVVEVLEEAVPKDLEVELGTEFFPEEDLAAARATLEAVEKLS